LKNLLNDRFEIGSAIDPGKKRKGGLNQDSMIVLLPSKGRKLPPVFVVADGMGGYSGGALASQIVIEQFRKGYMEYTGGEFVFQEFASVAIEGALREMHNRAKQDVQYENMGSTVVAISIDGENLNLVNIGDSRAYLVHETEMLQINYDHSFVGEAMRAGLLSKADAMKHPKKNQLTQSVTAKRLEVKPFYSSLAFAENDLVLLCSDGLWGVVPESIIHAVSIEMPLQQAAEKLVKLANSRGGPDNISVILCKQVGAVQENPFATRDEMKAKKGLLTLLRKIWG
jgi:serine/threonine protein phosphatase PrpC